MGDWLWNHDNQDLCPLPPAPPGPIPWSDLQQESGRATWAQDSRDKKSKPIIFNHLTFTHSFLIIHIISTFIPKLSLKVCFPNVPIYVNDSTAYQKLKANVEIILDFSLTSLIQPTAVITEPKFDHTSLFPQWPEPLSEPPWSFTEIPGGRQPSSRLSSFRPHSPAVGSTQLTPY